MHVHLFKEHLRVLEHAHVLHIQHKYISHLACSDLGTRLFLNATHNDHPNKGKSI